MRENGFLSEGLRKYCPHPQPLPCKEGERLRTI